MALWRKVTGTVLVDGKPEPNVKVYFYEKGTTNPIPVYSDEGSTSADNPQLTDASGRYAVYLDVETYPVIRIYLEKDGVDFTEANADLDGVPVPGAVGTVSIGFTDLSDTPSSYSGSGGKVVKVKSTEDGLEFGQVDHGELAGLSDDDHPQYLLADGSRPLSGDLDFQGHLAKVIGKLNFKDATTLTISSGAVTVSQSYHYVDTEGGASTDDLDTINGGTAGDILYLRAADPSRTVVIKHGTGNIVTPDGNDYSLDSTDKVVALLFDGTNWHLVRAAGGGASTFLDLTDTPSSFSGYAGYSPVVNDSESALEFAKRAAVTPGEITIYVDATTGSDATGDGSASNPFATIQKALDWFRERANIVAHDCVIAVGKGTYVLDATLNFSGLQILASLTIEARNTDGDALYDQGTASGGSSTTLQDSTKSWPDDFWKDAWVFIFRGTGAGQYRQISSNTADTLTVSEEWDTPPDSTSEYVIVGVKLDGATNSVEHAFEVFNLNNVNIYGLFFSGFTHYALTLTDTTGWNIQKNLIVSSSGRGVGLMLSRPATFRYNFINVSNYGLAVASGSNVTLYHNLFKAYTSGSGYGIYIYQNGSVNMSSLSTYKCTIQNWDIGIFAVEGGVCARGSAQIFSGNTTDYSPAGATDPAYIS